MTCTLVIKSFLTKNDSYQLTCMLFQLAQNAPKLVYGRGSAQDPTGQAHDAPQKHSFPFFHSLPQYHQQRPKKFGKWRNRLSVFTRWQRRFSCNLQLYVSTAGGLQNFFFFLGGQGPLYHNVSLDPTGVSGKRHRNSSNGLSRGTNMTDDRQTTLWRNV